MSGEPRTGDGGPGAYSGLASQARKMKDDVARMTTDLKRAEATGLGGGGLVRAVMSGEGKLVALDLDSSVIDPGDPGAIARLVIEAVNDATSQLTAQQAKRIAPLQSSLQAIITDLNGPGRTPR